VKKKEIYITPPKKIKLYKNLPPTPTPLMIHQESQEKKMKTNLKKIQKILRKKGKHASLYVLNIYCKKK